MVGLAGGSTWVHPFPPGLLKMVWRWWLPTQKLSSAWFSIRANCHFSCRPLEKAHIEPEIKNLFKINVRYVSIFDFIEGMLQYLKDIIRFQSVTKYKNNLQIYDIGNFDLSRDIIIISKHDDVGRNPLCWISFTFR